jgi:hypothetical protein
LSKNRAAYAKFTWANAFRDIVIAAMNKGQMPFIAIWLTVLWVIPWMDSKDIFNLLVQVLDALEGGRLWGWLLFVGALACWYYHAKWLRRISANETERIGKEKSVLQNKVGGRAFQSSGR